MKEAATRKPRKTAKRTRATKASQGTPKARTTKKPSQKADPEGLALTKTEILEFCDRVLKKWQSSPVENARNMPAMLAVRTSVFFSDEASLKAIWSEIVSWVYQLLYENAQAQAKKEGQEWARVFSKIKS